MFLVKCYHVIYRIFFDPLRSFPGPKLWAASKVPQVYSETSGNIVYDLLALHQKYGSIVRIGPNDLSFTSEGVWRDVFSYRMGHEEFSKVHIPPAMNGKYGILRYLSSVSLHSRVSNVSYSANRQDHARFRKVMSSSFSDKAIRDQQPIIQEYVDSLIESLRDQSDKEPQNIVQFLNWTTFDIIGKLALGESFGSLEKGQNHPWVSAIFKAVKIIVVVNGIKQLGFGSLLNYLMPLNANEARRLNWKLVSERVESRMQRGTNEGDFWDPILKRLQDEKLVSMSVEEMKCNASQLVLAGSETTATLLSGCLFYLLCNPSWIEKVTAEVRSSFQDSHDIDLFSVSSLKYMEAVLEESMRIYPPVPAQVSYICSVFSSSSNHVLIFHVRPFELYHWEVIPSIISSFLPAPIFISGSTLQIICQQTSQSQRNSTPRGS